MTAVVAASTATSRPRWVRSITCATSSSGKASSRLSPSSSAKSSHCRQQAPDRVGDGAVDLAQQRRDEEREPRRGHQHAGATVRTATPGDQPGRRERAADEGEDDVDAGDRRLRLEHDRAQHEQLADQGQRQDRDEEAETVLGELQPRPRREIAARKRCDRRSQDQSGFLTGRGAAATLTRSAPARSASGVVTSAAARGRCPPGPAPRLRRHSRAPRGRRRRRAPRRPPHAPR